MFDAIMTIATALFLARFWSSWRYRFFDYTCALAAIGGAFVVPLIAERYAPQLVDLGLLSLDAGGALIGCLVYDHLQERARA